MKIVSVSAHAFGPFGGDTIELAPGMTVISGPNEAGKSSWHAAIYAALCGVRRGRGRRQREDEVFADLHKPWDGDSWDVSCQVKLPDGRRVELRHDLLGQIDCQARDLDLGADVSSEIIYDGAPDGSRWLGLDRRTFLAVACVRQAEILEVTKHADSLQEHLQRAAATAGTDETAAAALVAIDDFRRNAVGSRRSNSTRPLQMAAVRLEAAVEMRDRAVEEHEVWLARQEDTATLIASAAEAEQRLRAAEDVYRRRQNDVLRQRLNEAMALAERHPREPPALVDDDSLAERVAAATNAWEQHQSPSKPGDPSSDELQRQLDELPQMPEGDLEPESSVTSATRTLHEAVSVLGAHGNHRPEPVESVDTRGMSSSELRELARELEVTIPQVDERLQAEVDRLRNTVQPTSVKSFRQTRVGAGAAIAFFVVSVVLVAIGQAVAGFVALVVGVLIGLLAGAAVARSRRPSATVDALRTAETRLLVAEQIADAARQRRAAAVARVGDLDLASDSSHLRGLADAADQSARLLSATVTWASDDERLTSDVEAARRGLIEALRSRAVAVEGNVAASDLEEAAASYEQDCRDRRRIAVDAGRRADLENALTARMRDEERFRADVEQAARIERELRDVAGMTLPDSLADVQSATADELTRMLREWQGRRALRRTASQEARRDWSRLEAILEGRTVADLEAELARAVRNAEESAPAPDGTLAPQIDLGPDPEHTVRQLRQAAQDSRDIAGAEASELRVLAQQLVSVPEAEEECDAASEDFARLERLDKTLDVTAKFLSDAQEQVHRDIAPVLQSKVRDRLERVTGGRYSDVIVDPQELVVSVRDFDGRWRNAALLSRGTAEQVYLLLRIAMAEILTDEGVACPLLLDDVTVQSDPDRTRAVLDVLHEASADHQMIVFTQEPVVIGWAEDHLGDRDKLIRLSQTSAGQIPQHS